MIGRTASSNPWIFRQIASYVKTGTYEHPTEEQRYAIMRSYYAMLLDKGTSDNIGKMKQFATYFTHGVRNGARLRAEIYTLHEPQPILDAVDRFFDRELNAPENAELVA
jgi:tRNA-dihydrouridine synthase